MTRTELKRRYDVAAERVERYCEIDTSSDACMAAMAEARKYYRLYMAKLDEEIARDEGFSY